jgi:UPF0716 protein FxsA
MLPVQRCRLLLLAFLLFVTLLGGLFRIIRGPTPGDRVLAAVVGGALLVTPGFVTDAVGLLLVAPPSRRLMNRLLRNRARAALGVPRRGRQQDAERDQVIDVEVVRVERNEPPEPGDPSR